MYPHERSLVQRHARQAFTLLGINSDQDRDELKKTIEEENITWRSWWDASVTGPIQTKWQVVKRPAIYVLDARGVIRFRSESDEGLDDVIDTLLAEAAAGVSSR